MALTLSSAARLKPEIRLAQAVSEFESILSGAQKAEFRGWRAQALKRPPDTTDVMRFTADVDRRIAKGNRCLGPRFTSFLSAVQQFAALGDVVVGGSQSIVACGVWSLVRMSILAVTNYSTYIESLSVVLMEIGRSSPRHQELALVYPRSLRLQACINEYFIVVVKLCLGIVRVAQKSILRQFTSTLSDPTIKATQSELATWARAIDDEMHVLVARRIENEAEENSRFRSLSKKFSKSVSHQQKVATKLRILNSCSTYDYETTWKQLRKCGTTTLFSQTLQYTEWRAEQLSCTLVYLGILGCGKSVTMANIVDDLNLFIAEQQNTSVLYFFVRHDLSDSMNARTIIGSIVRQLLRPKQRIVDATERDHDSVRVEDMLLLLRRSLPQQQKLYLVMDGLDLCTNADKLEVTDFITELQNHFLVLVCASYRHKPDVELEPMLQKLQSVQAVPLPNNQTDIELFIEQELSSRIDCRSLILGDPTLVLEIQDALLSGSQGMFLWVALQIHSLCALQTDDEIRDALLHLPQDLSAIYAQLLRKQSGPVTKYQRRVFELIAAAQRPLTTSEIREALSVEPGDTTWTAGKLINDVFAALSTCECLVIIDEEELTVRLVHHTVLQYLVEQYYDDISLESCHSVMADIAATYLSYGVLNTDLSTFIVPRIQVGSAPSNIISSTMGSSRSAQNIALRLLKLRKRADFDIGRTVAEGVQIDQQAEAAELTFHRYAKEYCLEHAARVPNLGRHSKRLLPSLLQRANCLAIAENECVVEAAKLSAVRHDAVDLMEMLLSLEVESVVYGKSKYDHISLAVCLGRERMLQMLLRDSSIDPRQAAWENRSPCLWAYQRASDYDWSTPKVVGDSWKIPLNAASHVCESGRSLLACSIWGRNYEVFSVLLENDIVDVNAGHPRMTPMWEAVRIGTQNNEGPEMLGDLISSGKVMMDAEEEEALIALALGLGNQHVLDILQRPMWYAVSRANIKLIKDLLRCDQPWKIEQRFKLMDMAAAKTIPEVWDVLATPLWRAVNVGDVDVVQTYLNTETLALETGEQAALVKFAENKGDATITAMLQALPDDAFVGKRAVPFVNDWYPQQQYTAKIVSTNRNNAHLEPKLSFRSRIAAGFTGNKEDDAPTQAVRTGIERRQSFRISDTKLVKQAMQEVQDYDTLDPFSEQGGHNWP